MMIDITEEDIKMNKEVDKWRYLAEDGKLRVRDDAPLEIKKHVEKMNKKFDAFGID